MNSIKSPPRWKCCVLKGGVGSSNLKGLQKPTATLPLSGVRDRKCALWYQVRIVLSLTSSEMDEYRRIIWYCTASPNRVFCSTIAIGWIHHRHKEKQHLLHRWTHHGPKANANGDTKQSGQRCGLRWWGLEKLAGQWQVNGCAINLGKL